MRATLQSLGLCAALFVLASGGVAAQGPRPMTLVDILNIPRLSDPQLSRDGRQVLYLLNQADWKTNARIAHIWRINVDGSGARQMTSGADGENSPRWSPDGRTIAFLARRAGSEGTQIYLLANDGGEARPLTNHVTSASNISWAPDGRSLYFTAADPKTEEEREREREKDDVFAFNENHKQLHLWNVSVADGVVQRTTAGDYSVRSYGLSRDGKKIVFHRAPTPLVQDGDLSEVWVMDAAGTGEIQLTRNSEGESGGEVSPDNSQVLFVAATNGKFEKYYGRNIFVVPSGGGDARILTEDLPYEVDQATWSDDGQAIFFVANMGVHSQLFRLNLSTGKPQQLTQGRHTISSWSMVPGTDRHIMTIDEPTNPGDLWIMPLSGATGPDRLTRVFDYLSREFMLPRQERMTWKGADGVTVEGLVHYPLDHENGRRYPLVVQTHGGPRTSDKFSFGQWRTFVQVLTARGYVVLQPNYRGSTGYGDAFLRDMVGGYFTNSHLDVMAGVDHLITMGLADPDRMVKMGWSAGGHMTNKIITFTNRFKAASSGAGAANWISMYSQSDTRSNRTPWFGGTPWEKDAPIDVYWEHSPLKYVANVTTPTIILVGENDERVPPPQSVELYRALKSNGVPTHLYMAPRTGHAFQELRHQLFKMNVELAWFEKHATERPYVWEKPPADTMRSEKSTTAGQQQR